MVLALLALASSVALGAVTYDVAAGATASARTASSVDQAVAQFELDPRGGVTWTAPRLELGGSYQPRLFVQEGAGGLQALHRASARAAWQWSGRWGLFAGLEGSYGVNDFLGTSSGAATSSAGGQPSGGGTGGGAGGAGGATPPVQPIPGATTLRYRSGEATLGVGGLLVPRHRFEASVSAFASGGADATARLSLPQQQGLRLGVTLRHSLSPVNTLESGLAAGLTSFGAGVSDAYVFATETWRHVLAGGGHFRLGAGPGLMVHAEPGSRKQTPGVGGEASFGDRWLRVLLFDVSLRVSPIVDRVSGALYQRADASAALGWEPATGWFVGVQGTGGVVVQGAQLGDQIVTGDLRASWSPSRRWIAGLGVRTFSQIPHEPLARATRETSAYLSLGFSDRFPSR
jgi:hypothetical protein